MELARAALCLCVLALARADTQSQGSLIASGEETHVRILVTRHGMSCTNLVEKKISKVNPASWQRGRIPDPSLSGIGVRGCEDARQSLERMGLGEPDVVVASVLSRAQETAARLYPGRTVYVLPSIHERTGAWENVFGAAKSNKPVERHEQRERLNAVVGNFAGDLLDYKYLDSSKTLEQEWSQGASWDAFKAFVASKMPAWLVAKKARRARTGPFTIAVVTHSMFMAATADVKDNCQEFYTKKPRNTQTFMLEYLWAGGKLKRFHGICSEVTGGVDEPFPARPTPTEIGDQCLRDLKKYMPRTRFAKAALKAPAQAH